MDDTHYITPPPASGSIEPEPHTPPRAATTQAEHPTPTMPNNVTGQNYVSDQDENHHILSKEISGKVPGPMPATEFLDNFLPKSTNLGATPAFRSMMDTTTEISMYKPFVSYFYS